MKEDSAEGNNYAFWLRLWRFAYTDPCSPNKLSVVSVT